MFRVGDVVRVRDWDEMKDEFGLDPIGDILCKFRFTTSMKRLCGNIYHISQVEATERSDERDTQVWLEEKPMFLSGSRSYTWCAGMLELVEADKNISIDNLLAFV